MTQSHAVLCEQDLVSLPVLFTNYTTAGTSHMAAFTNNVTKHTCINNSTEAIVVDLLN